MVNNSEAKHYPKITIVQCAVCAVFTVQAAHCALEQQFLFDGGLNLGCNHCIFLFFGRHGNVLRLHTRGKGTSRQNDEKNRKGIQQEQIVLERSARLNLDPG